MRSSHTARAAISRLQKNHALVMSCNRSFSTQAPPSTTTFEKMQGDKRYKAVSEVPENVLENMFSNVVYSPGFSIKGESIEGRPAYLDFQATTPQDPRVLDAMMPFMVSQYGNPHSRTHSFGWETEAAVEKAREEVASMIGCTAKEIIFTSGATESNNMAIKGVARFYKGKKNHVITTQTEHKCVLDSCRALESEGFDVTYLPVLPNGLVDLQLLKDTIRPDTCVISVMGVNNEIGVIQPLKAIGDVRERYLCYYIFLFIDLPSIFLLKCQFHSQLFPFVITVMQSK